jgi:N-acetyl-gamma-glutamyl-phosphate reductase
MGMIRVALAGGRGYVGEELLGLLAAIPDYEVVYVGSRSLAGQAVAAEFPQLPEGLQFQDLSPDSLRACPADFWILAQPNGQAADLVEALSGKQARIIDISSDFRFDDRWVYGLPERNEAAIAEARCIANPGCYATATQLALLPLAGQWTDPPTAFGISGYSGAGRTPGERNDPQRLADNILPYSLAGHTHEREASRHLGYPIRFMPHVDPFFRGISVTVNLPLREATSADQLHAWFEDYYEACPLVDVIRGIPEIRQVRNSNRAAVGGFTVDERDGRTVAVVCVIDNLRKGAASQVIQNLNLMCGFPSERGLLE